jgi:CSLREA domain-containing protein
VRRTRGTATWRGAKRERLGIAGVAILVAFLAAWSAAATPAGAAGTTVTVNTATDETTAGDGTCSLREAVLYANPPTAEPDCAATPAASGSTTTINLSAVTYTLTQGFLPINGSVVIAGQGAATTKIDAGGHSQVMVVGSGAVGSISGVSLTGGSSPTVNPCGSPCATPEFGAPGGGIVNAGTLTLTLVVVSGNVTGPGHSAINSFGAGQNAGPGGAGGGIFNTGTLTLDTSIVAGNTTGDGGAGTSGGPNPVAVLLDGGFGGNGGAGGGIANTGTLKVTDSTISGNQTGAGGKGGAGGNAAPNASNAGASGSGGAGGGIENSGALIVTDSTISGNKTGAGAPGATGGTNQGNGAGSGSNGGNGGNGGGIDSSTNMAVTNATFTGNATSGGGTAGAAGSGGGGVAGSAGAPGNGGAVNQPAAGASLTHVTIDANTAAGSGGGLNASGGAIAIGNSIVASNQGLPAAFNCAGMITDEGNNLVFGDASCPAGFFAGDPRLSALGLFGGPTLTQALLPGSAAIHHVPTCVLNADQRGVARPVGSACDAGAYEIAPPAIASPVAAASSTSTGAVTASINPDLSAVHTIVTVHYGTTTAYGSATAAQDLGAGNSPVSFAAAISGLAAGTTYHAQIVATNGDGTSLSPDLTFTTTAPLTAALPQASASGTKVTLTIACTGGDSGQACSGSVALTTHVKTRGGTPVAVTAAKNKKKKKKPHRPKTATKVVTVGSATYSSATGASATVTVPLNAAGRKLLGRFFRLPVTLTVSGTSTLTKGLTFSYSVVRSPISFTWAFSPSSTTAQVLTVSKVPAKGSVVVICHGGGCPFAKKSFTPHAGKVLLASNFKRGLKPHATLEIVVRAPNAVAKVALFTIQSGSQPTVVGRCLPPGAQKPTPCPKA